LKDAREASTHVPSLWDLSIKSFFVDEKAKPWAVAVQKRIAAEKEHPSTDTEFWKAYKDEFSFFPTPDKVCTEARGED
jgi:hypothetical protein